MRKDRLLIAMLLEDIDSDFSKELIQSVVNSLPADRDISLVTLPGKYYDDTTDPVNSEYRAVQNSVFHLASECRFDGMIIHLGSMSKNTKDLFRTIIMTKLADIPKVFIGLDDPGLTTVNYDNYSGIREAIEYLINICGMTRFCMLGGKAFSFRRRLTMELFAYLVYKSGAMCMNGELLGILWEGDPAKADFLRQLVKDMRDSFAAVGIEDIVIKRHGALGLNTEAYSIDGDISKLPDEFGWH